MHLQNVSVGLADQIREIPFVQPGWKCSQDKLYRPDGVPDHVHPDFVTCQFFLRTIEIELQLAEIQPMRIRFLSKEGSFISDGRCGQIVFNKWSRIRVNA